MFLVVWWVPAFRGTVGESVKSTTRLALLGGDICSTPDEPASRLYLPRRDPKSYISESRILRYLSLRSSHLSFPCGFVTTLESQPCSREGLPQKPPPPYPGLRWCWFL